MLKGLRALHTAGIVHRDVKSSNVFKQDETLKLGDLNMSKVVR